jgi:branched-chain amino acid transport system substrate-binding protein
VRSISSSWYYSSASRTKILDIGTALTLDKSTTYGYYGQHLKQAYTMYFDWLNENGGLTVGGEKYWVKLHLIDDKSSKALATNITRHLVYEKKIKHFLGPYGSGLTGQAAAVLNKTNAVMVCPCAASTSVFLNRPNMFGTLSKTSMFLDHVFTTLATMSAESVSYIYDATAAFSRGVCNQVQDRARKSDMRIIFGQGGYGGFYGKTQQEKNKAIEKLITKMSLMKDKPDILIGCVYAPQCKPILSTAAKLGFDPKAVVLTVCVTAGDFRANNGHNSGYVMGVAPWTTEVKAKNELTGMSVQEFTERYTKKISTKVPYIRQPLLFHQLPRFLMQSN